MNFQFFPQQVYNVFVVHGATVAIQIVDCILKLAVKDLEFHVPLNPVGKGLQCLLCLVDIHVLHFRVMVPSLECLYINSAIVFLDIRFYVRVCMRVSEMLCVMILCTASASNLYLLPVCGAANLPFSYPIHWSLWYSTEFWRITYYNAMPLAPTIISKCPRSSISHLSHWIADSNLTWKSSVIIASPFLFFLFCMILVRWFLLSSYVVWVHQRIWIYCLFLRVDAGLWPITWAIRVFFVVPPWLRIFHLWDFYWRIFRMLIGLLPHPHHWGVRFLRVTSTCLLRCCIFLLVCWCPT